MDASDLVFAWDPEKDTSNQRKHGIAFETATAVFYDPLRSVKESTRPEFGERRWKIVGRVGSEIVSVIYTMRDAEIRIISARKASRHERREFGSGQTAP